MLKRTGRCEWTLLRNVIGKPLQMNERISKEQNRSKLSKMEKLLEPVFTKIIFFSFAEQARNCCPSTGHNTCIDFCLE